MVIYCGLSQIINLMRLKVSLLAFNPGEALLKNQEHNLEEVSTVDFLIIYKYLNYFWVALVAFTGKEL